MTRRKMFVLIIINLIIDISIGYAIGSYVGSKNTKAEILKSINNTTLIDEDLAVVMASVNKDKYSGTMVTYGVNDSTVGYIVNTTSEEDGFVKESKTFLINTIGVGDIKFLKKDFNITRIEVRNIIGQHHTFTVEELLN